jgi:hypothetical protein
VVECGQLHLLGQEVERDTASLTEYEGDSVTDGSSAGWPD